jgi:hypothetical protein
MPILLAACLPCHRTACALVRLAGPAVSFLPRDQRFIPMSPYLCRTSPRGGICTNPGEGRGFTASTGRRRRRRLGKNASPRKIPYG